jgi:hypothetical protein
MQAYKKPGREHEEMVYGGTKGKKRGKKGGGGGSPRSTRKVGAVSMTTAPADTAKHHHEQYDSRSGSGGGGGSSGSGGGGKGKEKGEFVNLYSKEGVGVATLVPGRHVCGCCASKHALINNCLSCGRVVCSQEGAGPCLTVGCGELVVTPAQQEALQRGSRKSEKLLEKILKESSEGERIAKERKNKLLHFQKTGARRMRVIDDESDYFSHDSNKWLSAEDKKALKKKEEEMREAKEKAKRSMTFQLDFAGRKIVDYDATKDLANMYDEATHFDGNFEGGVASYGGDDGGAGFGGGSDGGSVGVGGSSGSADYGTSGGDGSDGSGIAATTGQRQDALQKHGSGTAVSNNPYMAPDQQKPTFLSSVVAGGGDSGGSGGAGTVAKSLNANPKKAKKFRLQDENITAMADGGMCLSMHQPWASLLVRGIKQHEGRSWYVGWRSDTV